MRVMRQAWLLGCALGALAVDVGAQPKPDFTGAWVLNSVESHDSLGKPLPYSTFRLTLVHREPSLYLLQEAQMRRTGSRRQLRHELRIGEGDTAVRRNSAERARLTGMQASAWWEGAVLGIAYEGRERDGKTMRIVHRLRMAPNGRRVYSKTEVSRNGERTAGSPHSEVFDRR